MKPNLQDYPKFYRWLTLPFRKAKSDSGPSKDESNLDVRHARHLRPGLLLAVFKENFNGRNLAFYLDPCFRFCLV